MNNSGAIRRFFLVVFGPTCEYHLKYASQTSIMQSPKEFLDRFKRGPSDLVGIDVGTTGTKVVRMRKGDEGVSLVTASLLPAVTIPEEEESASALKPIKLPAGLRAKHAALAFTGQNAIVKLLTFPGRFDAKAEAKVIDNMGLDEPERYRIAYKLVTEGHGRAESRALTVAWTEKEAALAHTILPVGLPVPHSLEVSGLAAVAAFLRGPGSSHADGAVGSIDFGATTTTFVLFNKGVLALVRRFGFGTDIILRKVQESLGVDKDTAEGIITDGSFDISQPVNEVMTPLIKQLIVSRDFVERRENCHVGKMYVSGGLVMSHDSLEEMRTCLEVDIELWNPLQGLVSGKDSLPEELAGQEWRFSAAIGACLGTFEET